MNTTSAIGSRPYSQYNFVDDMRWHRRLGPCFVLFENLFATDVKLYGEYAGRVMDG